MTLRLAAYVGLLSIIYAVLSLTVHEVADAGLLLFVALLLIPTTIHQTAFLRNRRRRDDP